MNSGNRKKDLLELLFLAIQVAEPGEEGRIDGAVTQRHRITFDGFVAVAE